MQVVIDPHVHDLKFTLQSGHYLYWDSTDQLLTFIHPRTGYPVGITSSLSYIFDMMENKIDGRVVEDIEIVSLF